MRAPRTAVALLAAGTLTAGIGAGVALAGGGGGSSDRADAIDAATVTLRAPQIKLPRELDLPREFKIPHDFRVPNPPAWPKLRWQAGDVISVRGTKCPKSHPHKVGSSSAGSWTQINGGKVEHSSSRRTLCAR
jgi:hypothetical protein